MREYLDVSPEFGSNLYLPPQEGDRRTSSIGLGQISLGFWDGNRRGKRRSNPVLGERVGLNRVISQTTGRTEKADVYICRKVANELTDGKAVARAMEKATLGGTYRYSGLGSWHFTICRTVIDIEGRSNEDLSRDIENSLTRGAESLLHNIIGLQIIGAELFGNTNGGQRSSRYLALILDSDGKHSKILKEEMGQAEKAIHPLVDARDQRVFDRPHVSIAYATQKFLGSPQEEQKRIEAAIFEDLEGPIANMRPLLFTSGRVTISDHYDC